MNLVLKLIFSLILVLTISIETKDDFNIEDGRNKN